MAQPNQSAKRLMISKANGTMVSVIAAASFVVIFCLVASYTLVGQLSYQNRVIGKKKVALKQLETNLSAVENLNNAYSSFIDPSQSTNVIGGIPSGAGDKDGDNAQIVLDALPSKYDYPALITSIEKIASMNNVKIQSISGTDDEAGQGSSTDSSAPIAMPFQVTIVGGYQAIQDTINSFERSIRPFQIQTLAFTGGEANMQLQISGQSYYQPAKVLKIKTEVVK